MLEQGLCEIFHKRSGLPLATHEGYPGPDESMPSRAHDGWSCPKVGSCFENSLKPQPWHFCAGKMTRDGGEVVGGGARAGLMSAVEESCPAAAPLPLGLPLHARTADSPEGLGVRVGAAGGARAGAGEPLSAAVRTPEGRALSSCYREGSHGPERLP